MQTFNLQLAFEDAAAGSGIVGMLLPMAIMFAIFYFLLIRPQQKQRKKEQSMREALKAGDEVLTQSGIIGTIRKVTDQHFVLELEEGSIKIAKAAVVQIIEPSKS